MPGHFAKDILPNGHFAERTFCSRTFCRTDVFPNGHFAEGTFCRTDSLPKIQSACAIPLERKLLVCMNQTLHGFVIESSKLKHLNPNKIICLMNINFW